MKYGCNNNKGFSLVELLVVLGIAAIVISAIGTFLIMNLKSFHLSSDESQLQSQGQKAMNQLMSSLIEAKKITAIEGFKPSADGSKSENTVDLLTIGNNYITKIVIENANTTNNSYVFEHHLHNTDEENNKLIWGEGSSTNANSIAATFIETLKIEPLPQNSTYQSAKGLKIQLILKENETMLQLENQVYFRNAK